MAVENRDSISHKADTQAFLIGRSKVRADTQPRQGSQEGSAKPAIWPCSGQTTKPDTSSAAGLQTPPWCLGQDPQGS